MQISHNGLEFVKGNEGYRAQAYLDGGGVWTIGYGTTRINGKPVEAGMTCTEQEATQWLLSDLADTQTAINQLVNVPLTQGAYDALCDFVYNVGITAFKNSTMLKKLDAKDYSGAALEFIRWKYDNGKVVEGLLNRRKREQEMFK